MSYQIRKGWPAQAAIDEALIAADGEKIENGMIVTVADGKCKKANFLSAASAADPMTAFVISNEQLRGTYTGIMSQCVIEVDKDHYEAGSYKANDPLTAKNGKFSAAGTSKVLGRVLSFDAASGIMRLMWYAAH